MRMIFVNLPVKDLTASKAFLAALGFDFNPEFSDGKAACMVVDQNVFGMLVTRSSPGCGSAPTATATTPTPAAATSTSIVDSRPTP